MNRKGVPQSRYFAIVSYVKSAESVQKVLDEKKTQIRAFAYICHDRDPTDKHFHIVLRLYAPRAVDEIHKWFYPNEDEQNVFVEFVRDRKGVCDYLTHKNNPEKQPYPEENIVDGGLADIIGATESPDNSEEIIDDLLKGVSCREMVRRYGRQFIYHYRNYKEIQYTIFAEEKEDVENV